VVNGTGLAWFRTKIFARLNCTEGPSVKVFGVGYNFANYLALLLAHYSKWHHPARGHWPGAPGARAALEQNLPLHQVAQMRRLPIRTARRWVQKLRIGRIDRTA
jgi:hypothetical protein